MKILFSNPPWWEAHREVTTHTDGYLRQGIRAGSRWPFTRRAVHAPDAFRFGGYLPFPFFLAHAAGHTQREIPGAHVVLRDSVARGESYNAYFEHIADERYDVIVVETATPSWPHDQHLLERYRALSPESKIVLGGTLPCDQAEAIFRAHPNVIAIVQGEYDKQVAKAIQGHAFAPQRVYAHDLLTLEEMNAAPPPLWDEACATHYWDPCPAGQHEPQMQIFTTRGCYYKCVFCVWPAVMTSRDPDGTGKRTVRHYSSDYIETHIRARLALHPYKSVYIDDDFMNTSDRHVLKVCEIMKRIGLPWSAMCRADTIRKDTWTAMRESGCFGVKIGIESGNQWVLDNIVNKRLQLSEALATLAHLKAIGMAVHTTFTLGLPGETRAQQQDTIAFIQQLYTEGLTATHQLSGTSEIEGTPLATLRERGHLDAYAGAKIDANYISDSDGQRKIESMQR